jgi:hypothetical protein
MKYKILCGLLFVVSLSACTTSSKSPTKSQADQAQSQAIQHTGTGVLVIKTINFSNDAYIRDAIKKECNLIGKLTQFIEQNAAGQYAQIVTDSNNIPTDAQVLEVEIYEAQGGGGGAWSGPKAVLIKGSLSQNGQKLGSFIARRYSGGGMFAMYKGTCSILGRCVRTLGKDVATWLTNPKQNAVLGNL